MTLYARIQEGELSPQYRPATESEVLSAYGAVMVARRKHKSGGPKRKLTARHRAEIRAILDGAEQGQRSSLIEQLAKRHGVSTRTIRRAL